ncbi:hypothetical protein JW887_01705 [Candidatus Dojkabacteria bacterium]|nr:hypothetical protein [Candidatus Dojkabacteria bacterium]
MKKLLEGEKLEEYARRLGVDTQGDAITCSSMGRHKRADDSELQRRVIEAERSIREHQLWIIALISAISSMLSAVIALFATFSN